jgi:hypothetical protein
MHWVCEDYKMVFGCPFLKLLVKNVFPSFLYIIFSNIFTAANESEEQQKLRFQVELEFVQCLANPNYLHCKSIEYPSVLHT